MNGCTVRQPVSCIYLRKFTIGCQSVQFCFGLSRCRSSVCDLVNIIVILRYPTYLIHALFCIVCMNLNIQCCIIVEVSEAELI